MAILWEDACYALFSLKFIQKCAVSFDLQHNIFSWCAKELYIPTNLIIKLDADVMNMYEVEPILLQI